VRTDAIVVAVVVAIVPRREEEASGHPECPPEGIIPRQAAEVSARRTESDDSVAWTEEFHDADEDVIVAE
jgi:hypothetical protein